MSFRLTVLAAAVALAAAAPAHAGYTNVFDFTPVAGDTTTFILDGTTFSSPTTAGFTVGAGGGIGGVGNYPLITSGVTAAELDIAFPSVVNYVTFAFAIQDLLGSNPPDSLTVTTNTGSSSVVETVDTSGLFPEGTVTLTGSGFTSIAITSDNAANTFAIGGLSVPEPATLALLATGIAGLAASRRRRA